MVCPYIHPSATLVHCANAAGQNKMPFNRITHAAPINIIFRQEGLSQEGEIGGQKPQSKIPLHIADRIIIDNGIITY